MEDRYLSSGAAKDGIPSIDDPRWVSPDDRSELGFLDDGDQVVGFTIGDRAYAVPVSILRYHEIVNATFATGDGRLDLAITHCPLTGTSLVFDRAAIGGAELGVSGLLYQSNLVMYDRSGEESLWPQMLGEARCGPALGTKLDLRQSIEMRWDGWASIHPDTEVLAAPEGSRNTYDDNPYAGYDAPHAEYTFPMPPLDERLPPKASVLGVLGPTGVPWVFPRSDFEDRESNAVLHHSFGPGASATVVMWDRTRDAMGVYERQLDGITLSFGADADGFFDGETRSRWTVDGLAVEGPLAGERLQAVHVSYAAYWGAWAAFFPFTRIWGRSGGISD